MYTYREVYASNIAFGLTIQFQHNDSIVQIPKLMHCTAMLKNYTKKSDIFQLFIDIRIFMYNVLINDQPLECMHS